MNEQREKELDPLRARILLLVDFQKFRNLEIALLVEGSTDNAFVNKLKIKNLICIPVDDYSRANAEIRNFADNFRKDEENVMPRRRISNSRRDVEDVTILLRQSGKQDVQYFGLVDKDFTSEKSHENILVTPTHDLETLLFKTQPDIFEAPENITEDFKKAIYLAYLIGMVKQYSREYLFNDNLCEIVKYYNKHQNAVPFPFETFIELVVRELIEKRKDGQELQQNEKLQQGQYLCEKNILTDECDYMEAVLKRNDLYNIANGHDVLNIMALLCENQINNLVAIYDTKRHRYTKKEHAVIEKYDIRRFAGCSLYKDMIQRNFQIPDLSGM